MLSFYLLLGPPDPKRPRALTGAERAAKYRANRSAKKKEEDMETQKAAMAKVRQEQTTKKRQATNAKQKAAMIKLRKEQTAEEREAVKDKQKVARQQQTAEEKEAAKKTQRAAMAILRQNQTVEEREATKATQKKAMKTLRKNCRAGVENKEALLTDEIISGSHHVPDLKDTIDTIGKMDIVCQFCGALKFKKETGSTCCSNGKVHLDPLPQPPEQINKLWHEDTPEGRLFRQHARSINNAVCLTSIKGKQKTFGGGFAPNVIYEGKVTYRVGPLQAAEGEKPCFAQLYVHDPSLETGLRLSGMTIPAGTSIRQKKILQQVLVKVQNDLHQFNPFVHDFKQIVDIPETELGEAKIVISAKARPFGEHERRYNEQVRITIA